MGVDFVFRETKDFAKPALEQVALWGISHTSRCGYAYTWRRKIRAVIGADACEKREVGTTVGLACVSYFQKVGIATQAARWTEFVSPDHWKACGVYRRLCHREACAAFAAASVDDGASAACGHACAEADLANSFNAVWSKCRSHGVKMEKDGENGESLPCLSSFVRWNFVLKLDFRERL